MNDLVGLDSLVANTACLRTMEIDHNQQRMRREPLTLPKPKKFSAPRAAAEKTYESLCEQQPIGRKLFQQFLLTSDPQCVAAVEFLEELSNWSFSEGGTKEKAKQRILSKFCQPTSQTFLSFLTAEDAKMCLSLSDKNDEAAMELIREATRKFLKGKPFFEYLKSPFFYMFLQWKECERQKITDRYFYEFMTLGRGGFGEVGTKLVIRNDMSKEVYRAMRIIKYICR